MNIEFKILLIKLVKFSIIFILLDFTLGYAARFMFCNQESGKYYRLTNTMDNVEDDLLIFGSSIASRHYIPSVFEEELGITCYNAGVQGTGVIFAGTLQNIVLQRIAPKFVILNVDPDMLFYRPDILERLSDLNPYYNKYPEVLKKTVNIESKYNHLKLLFTLYQYNSTLVHIINYLIVPQVDYKGYRPLTGVFSKPSNSEIVADQEVCFSEKVIDPNCIIYYKSFIESAQKKGVRVILVASPNLRLADSGKNASFMKMSEIANSYNIPIISFINNEDFINHYELFNDQSHLNNNGATLFSNMLAKKINEAYSQVFVK